MLARFEAEARFKAEHQARLDERAESESRIRELEEKCDIGIHNLKLQNVRQ